MKYTTAVCLTFSSMLLCACTQSSVDVEAERTALRAAADAYHEAGEGLDADGFASSYTSNGLILPPNEAAVTGRDGAYEFIASFAEAPGASVSFSNMNVDVAASGDIGYTLADAVVTVDGPDGQPIEDKIRDFHLWKKQDGQWKIAIDIWNSELPLPGVEDTSEADREAISQISQREIEAFSAGDVETFGSIFTEDAVFMPPNEPGFQGAEALENWLRGLYDQVSIQAAYTGAELTIAGDWAFEQYAFTLMTTPVAGGGGVEGVAKGLHIYRRQPDGAWKITLDIWNTDSPPASGQ